MGWRGYIHIPKKTVFFWSQKAACTSLFRFLADNIEVPPENKRYFHLNSQSYKQCLEVMRKKRYRSVILARHPVTRSISAYLNKFCVYRGRSLMMRDDLEPFAQELHDLYCTERGLETERNIMTFAQFLDTVAALHDQRLKPRLPVNGHWETQVPGFLLDEGLHYDDIIHVEALDSELGALAADLGMRYHSRQMNKTQIADERYGGSLVDVPGHEISEYSFGYENFITPLTLRRIQSLYAVDLETFGYRPEPALRKQPTKTPHVERLPPRRGAE